MKRFILFSFLLFVNIIVYSKQNYDSLLVIAETSNAYADFKRIDSILELTATEFNQPIQKKLIFMSANRTKELNFDFLHAKFIYRLSLIYTVQGDIGSAMNLTQEALLLFSKYPTMEIARCYNSMGGMVANQGDIETGLRYLEKATQITTYFKTTPKHDFLVCDNLIVTAYIHLLNKDFDTALLYLNNCEKASKKISYWNTLTYTYLNFADVYRQQKKYDLANEMAKKSVDLAIQENADNLLCVGKYRIAQIFDDKGQIDSALNYYAIAENLALKQNLGSRLLAIYKNTIAIYTKKNDFENNSIYQSKYIDLLISTEKKEKESRLQMMQIKFDVDEKTNKIFNLSIDKKHELERNKLLTVAIIITVTAFVLLIILVVLLFNRTRLNKKIKEEVHKKNLSKHQLKALQSQMNPHFIFNALNSIQDLILKENTEDSYTYISKFASLIRKTLNHSSEEFIDIEEEIASIRLYLELEELRFKDIVILLETNGVKNISIPPLLIQPFIENAFKHGLFHKAGAKHLRIKFQLKDNLICTISDNGIGRTASAKIQERRLKSHASYAVQSIEDRFILLRHLYKDNLGITYVDLESETGASGTTVILSLPFKRNF